MPDFNRSAQHGETVFDETGATRAVAHLPGIEIEITRRRAAEGNAEHVSINLTAVPSFEAFARAFEAANPFSLWMRGIQLAWRPWMEATQAMGLRWATSPALTAPDADDESDRQDGSRERDIAPK